MSAAVVFPAPFDGAISDYFEHHAPQSVRDAITAGDSDDILTRSYPYRREMSGKDYDAEMKALQIELAKFQAWLRAKGERVAVIFEGRDAAGKGGAIARVRENLNPRVASVVALSKPTEHEAAQWYFQRYLHHLPAGGEIKLFDRSWYNRAVVEQVFGFCTQDQRAQFFDQVPQVENLMVQDGVRLIKIWLNVGRAEQLRRFLAREADPLKHWKLSRIDVDGLGKWDAYSAAIAETFARSHHANAPWVVIRADDKKRARLAVIRAILCDMEYAGKDAGVIGRPDPLICGGPEIWTPDG